MKIHEFTIIASGLDPEADGYEDRVLIGEIFLPNDRHARWYGSPERPQVHLPFNFQLIECAWDAAALRRVIGEYERSLPAFGWPNWVLGSHDAPRIALPRYGLWECPWPDCHGYRPIGLVVEP